jgi:hypothetical protein
MVKIFKRDPAVILGFIAVVVQAAVSWGVDLSDTQQAYINAAATAVMGLLIACSVARDQIVPAAGGALVAVLQLLVAFNVPISQDKIATAAALLTAGLAFFIRTQVTAKVAADGSPVPRVTVKG